nr:hypothetical protein [Tanacetum cinerariifolium]
LDTTYQTFYPEQRIEFYSLTTIRSSKQHDVFCELNTSYLPSKDGHIAKILKVLDPIEVDSLDPFQLRMMTFPLSLSQNARKWWMSKGDGKINTWEELVNDEEGLDPLKFITWRNSKFKDHKKVDETTKRALLYSWIEVGNNEGGDAKKWWDNEEAATTWKELCDKSFHKYFTLSHAYKSNIPDDIGHGTDYFELLYWLASKFDNSWELDKNVKNELWEFYINGRTNGTIDDLVNESCNESNKNTCSDSFFKPYLDAQDEKDIYKIKDRDYSLIPIPTHRDISKPDELCQTEEFAVVRYSVKEKQEKDKIGSKPDKNGKRGEAGKSLKQLQWIKEEKSKKTQKEWSKTHTR